MMRTVLFIIVLMIVFGCDPTESPRAHIQECILELDGGTFDLRRVVALDTWGRPLQLEIRFAHERTHKSVHRDDLHKIQTAWEGCIQ